GTCAVRGGGRTAAGSGHDLGEARGSGVDRPAVAPGAAEGVGESGGPLDGPDGVRRAPRGADGQQHGGTRPAWSGGRAEELLRVGSGVGGASGGHDVLALPDVVPVAAGSAGAVNRVPRNRSGCRGLSSAGDRAFLAVEPERGGSS